MKADAVRMGVVGCGSVSVRGILPHLSQDDVRDRLRVVAVCDPAPGRAEAAAARFGVGRAFTDYDDLLAHGRVDAVTIATPIGLHYQQARRALEAGVHVHCNKTMTTTVAEADDLIDLARDRGCRLVASPGQMLLPHNQEIKRLIAEGRLGRLCWAACGASLGTYHEDEEVRQGDDVLSSMDPAWYFRRPGGGPLYDATAYALHALTGILGPVVRVTAMSGARIRGRTFRGRDLPAEADDSTLMLLDLGDGLFALAYGMPYGDVAGLDGSYFGTAGAITGLLLDGEPLDYPGRELVEREYPEDADYRLLPHVVGPHREIEEMHVYEDVMQLVDWIREDRPSIVTAEHARHVIDIVESAYRAAATGRTQHLTTTF